MRKPTPTELDLYIYDLGFEEALKLFKLTEQQATRILFKTPDKPAIKITLNGSAFILPEVNQDNLAPLYGVIKKHYKELRKKYCGEAKNNSIDKFSNNLEDSFHNSLLKLIENSENFNYLDDDSTLSYIKSQLYLNRRSEIQKVRRNKIQYTNICDIDLIEESEIQTDNLTIDPMQVIRNAHNIQAA